MCTGTKQHKPCFDRGRKAIARAPKLGLDHGRLPAKLLGNLDSISRMDGVCCRFDDLISILQFAKYLDLSIHRLPRLNVHPLCFAVPYSYDKRVLLVGGHRSRGNEESRISAVDRPENAGETPRRKFAVGIRGVEFDGHRSRLVVHLMRDAFDWRLER